MTSGSVLYLGGPNDDAHGAATQINLIPSRFILLYSVRSVMPSSSAVVRRLKLFLRRH